MREVTEHTRTQAKDILRYMREHGSITQVEAAHEIGCYKLPARIYDLKVAGHVIDKEMVNSKNRYGHHCSYARYRLKETT